MDIDNQNKIPFRLLQNLFEISVSYGRTDRQTDGESNIPFYSTSNGYKHD